jgi:hypothetical protein
MKTETLQRKLERYINGESMPAETRQIQSWLSCTTTDIHLTPEQKSQLELEILAEIQAETAYPLFYPKKEKPWWQKMQKVVASFL